MLLAFDWDGLCHGLFGVMTCKENKGMGRKEEGNEASDVLVALYGKGFAQE
jgi:hypothetical protein